LRISYRRGARRWHDARLAGTVAFGMSIIAMTVAACALFAFPDFFLGLYINLTDPANAETVHIARQLMPFACVFVFLDGFYGPGMGSLRGLNDNRFPMLLVGVVYWGVGMPIAYLTTQVWDLGPAGLWYGLDASLILLSIALTWRYLARSKTKKSAQTASGTALPGPEAELAAAALHEVE
jgi:multidrug resistance protein, MATE family